MSFNALTGLLETSLGIAYVDLLFLFMLGMWVIMMVTDQRIGSIVLVLLSATFFIVLTTLGMDASKFLYSTFVGIVIMALMIYTSHKRGGGFVG